MSRSLRKAPPTDVGGPDTFAEARIIRSEPADT
jgi:hypothetical protein